MVLFDKLEPEEMGLFSGFYGFLLFSRSCGSYGGDQYILHNSPQGIRITAYNITSRLILIAIITGSFFFAFFYFFLSNNFFDAMTDLIMGYYVVIAYSVTGIFAATIRGAGMNIYSQLPETIIVQSLILLFTFSFAVSNFSDVLKYIAIASSFSLAAYVFLYLKFITQPYQKIESEIKFSELSAFFVSQVTTAALIRLPVIMPIFFGIPNVAAVVDFVTRFGSLGGLANAAISATSSTKYAKSRTNIGSLRKEISNATKLGIFSHIAVFIFLCFLHYISPYFIEEHLREYFNLVYLVAFAYFINGTIGCYATAASMCGKPGIVTKWSFISVTIFLTMSAFVPILKGFDVETHYILAASFALILRDTGVMMTLNLKNINDK